MMTVLSFQDGKVNRFKRGLDELFNKTMRDCMDIFDADDDELESMIKSMSPVCRQYVENLNTDGLRNTATQQGIDDELFEFMLDSSINMMKIVK